MFYQWRPYVSVAQRRRQAAREMDKLGKKGHPVSPVTIEGRTIASTFWGKAWCDNLERYSDYENRMPRGRTYVRNGSVVDLQVAPGLVTARVSGSELYQVEVTVGAVAQRHWESICADCAGGIDSLVELLQGRFAKGVMERICLQGTGLFPTPEELSFSCSCPDWASMCKHVAAALYGVGARFDASPELLFRLRHVDESELVARADAGLPLSKKATKSKKVLADGDLSQLFDLDLDTPAAPAPKRTPAKARKPKVKATSKAKPTVRRKQRRASAGTTNSPGPRPR
jgi:uncharacterized Zn finger protein